MHVCICGSSDFNRIPDNALRFVSTFREFQVCPE